VIHRTVFLAPLLFAVTYLPAQTSQRDVQAITQLTQAVTALGILPTDAVSTGTVTISAGGSEVQGAYRLLARGTTQTAEHFVVGNVDKQIIASNYQAIQRDGDSVVAKSLELATTALSFDFPLTYLNAVLTDTDYNVQSLGQETVNGRVTNRLRIWKNFSDISQGQRFASLSGRIVWLDAQTFLPVKASWIRRGATGAVPSTRVDVFLNDYRAVNGVVVPFSVQQSLNGTPWATLTIQSVSFNNGLTDSDFLTE